MNTYLWNVMASVPEFEPVFVREFDPGRTTAHAIPLGDLVIVAMILIGVWLYEYTRKNPTWRL